MKRKIRVAEKTMIGIGCYLSNNGLYPGWKDDVMRYEAIEEELKRMRERTKVDE